MRYVVMGLTYANAVKLKLSLRTRGVEAGETAGALAIYPATEDQVGAMYAICCEHGTTPKEGTSLMEDLGTGKVTIEDVIAAAELRAMEEGLNKATEGWVPRGKRMKCDSCNFPENTVYRNPYSKAVRCHNCGAVPSNKA